MSDTSAKLSRTRLTTGATVLESGVYHVSHPQHRLPEEVTLIRNQLFPRCSRCSEVVFYELVRSVPSAGTLPGTTHFTVALYELPVIEEEDSPDESVTD